MRNLTVKKMNKPSIKKFSRYELKYIIPTSLGNTIARDLLDYLDFDSYGDKQGTYPITSLYYDSPDYSAYWDKIEGERFRRKVRVRIYGGQSVGADDKCAVEIKQRINKSVQKKRVFIPCTSAISLCEHGVPATVETDADRMVVQEVQYLSRTLRLQPTCIVAYNRQAFNGGLYDSGLRVTFDTALKGRLHSLSLLDKHLAENHFFLSPEWCIMEVKVNQRVPYWLVELLNKYQCTLRRISKYCTALETFKTSLLAQQIEH